MSGATENQEFSFSITNYQAQSGDYLKYDGQTQAGLMEIQGKRGNQEDYMAVTQASAFAQLNGDQLSRALLATFADMQAKHGHHDAGSTAVAAFARIDSNGLLKATSAHVGDSEAYVVVVDKEKVCFTQCLTPVLHDPDNERERLKNAGHFVLWGRVDGVLAVSRAIGDASILTHASDHIPDINHLEHNQTLGFRLESGQQAFLVVACDGLFEAFKHKDGDVQAEKAKLIGEHVFKAQISTTDIANSLVETAFGKGKGSGDNISVAVVPVTKYPVSAVVFDGHGGNDVSKGMGADFYPALETNITKARKGELDHLSIKSITPPAPIVESEKKEQPTLTPQNQNNNEKKAEHANNQAQPKATTSIKTREIRVVPGFNVVAFYSREDEFGWMANTYRGYPVIENMTRYLTTEHYFQAKKFPGNTVNEINYRREILAYDGSYAVFPEFARNTAKKYNLTLSADWDNKRSLEVMRQAVVLKLNTYPELEARFLQLPTNTIIVEASKKDKKWGDGDNGTGRNLLGKIYMEQLLMRKGGLTESAAIAQADSSYATFDAYRAKHFPNQSLIITHGFFKRHPNLKNALLAMVGALVMIVSTRLTGYVSTNAIMGTLSTLGNRLATLFVANASPAMSLGIGATALLGACAAAVAVMGTIYNALKRSMNKPSQSKSLLDVEAGTAKPVLGSTAASARTLQRTQIKKYNSSTPTSPVANDAVVSVDTQNQTAELNATNVTSTSSKRDERPKSRRPGF